MYFPFEDMETAPFMFLFKEEIGFNLRQNAPKIINFLKPRPTDQCGLSFCINAFFSIIEKIYNHISATTTGLGDSLFRLSVYIYTCMNEAMWLLEVT